MREIREIKFNTNKSSNDRVSDFVKHNAQLFDKREQAEFIEKYIDLKFKIHSDNFDELEDLKDKNPKLFNRLESLEKRFSDHDASKFVQQNERLFNKREQAEFIEKYIDLKLKTPSGSSDELEDLKDKNPKLFNRLESLEKRVKHDQRDVDSFIKEKLSFHLLTTVRDSNAAQPHNNIRPLINKLLIFQEDPHLLKLARTRLQNNLDPKIKNLTNGQAIDKLLKDMQETKIKDTSRKTMGDSRINEFDQLLSKLEEFKQN
jgi:hypothetical protein